MQSNKPLQRTGLRPAAERQNVRQTKLVPAESTASSLVAGLRGATQLVGALAIG